MYLQILHETFYVNKYKHGDGAEDLRIYIRGATTRLVLFTGAARAKYL
jgi:hypothetical protein